jgi:hypothetical protein
MKALALAALLATLGTAALTGCGSEDGGDGDAGDAGREPGSSSSTATEELDLATTRVCDLVRRGVDAFNRGDVEETIERFQEAVPLAEELATQQPSADTRRLRDAVEYYAGIPADEYVEANDSDPTFADYRDFTLVTCEYDGPLEPSDTGIPA